MMVVHSQQWEATNLLQQINNNDQRFLQTLEAGDSKYQLF